MNDISCVIDWPGTMNATKDVVIAIAAAVTALAAYRGIGKWRQEESGKADFDLARRVGIVMFRLRDALSDARRPIFAYELLPQGVEEAEFSRKTRESLNQGDMASAMKYGMGAIEARKANEARDLAHVFETRYQHVRQCDAELQMLRNEVEALWGSAVVPQLKELSGAVTRLVGSVNAHIARLERRNENPELSNQPDDDVESNIFAHVMVNDRNEVTEQIINAVDQISTYLKTKLPKSSK